MCGIAGIFLPKRHNPQVEKKYQAELQQILNAQAFRGPDHQKFESILSPNAYMLLGHNRLSIIDLHESSHQPMWDDNKRFCISYNGMLYNYVALRDQLKTYGYTFYSEGDTEVVLKSFIHWGDEAFNLFNGMFAIAIYDVQTERLYLARDRFGVKPLFYHMRGEKIYFASTSSVIASLLNLQPNMAFLARGLTYWCYDREAESAYQDLRMVAPSEVLSFHFKNGWQANSKKYYSLHDRVYQLSSELTTHKNLAERAEFLLHDAIKIRLQSDVPLGVSLSGGLDSTLIASIAKTNLPALSAFTFGSLQHDFSEAALAKKIAEKSGINLHYVFPSLKDLYQGFWQSLYLQDSPFPNFSVPAQYFVFKAAREQGIKVMLGGQGGDEIFMGYRKYFLFQLKKLLQEQKYIAALGFLIQLMPTVVREIPNLKSHIFNSKRYNNKLFAVRWQKYIEPLNLHAFSNDPLWQRQVQDITSFSLPTLLRYEDRNSMGNSIETRLPFLDYRLVELALSLPTVLKLHKGYGKRILRDLGHEYIPKEILWSRTKRGFDVQTSNWVNAGIGESLRAAINSNRALIKKMGLEQNVNSLFTDQALINNRFLLAECITLAWLAHKNYFSWS